MLSLRKKSGPPPLPPLDFANRHAEKLNFSVRRILEDRKFLVVCKTCSLERVVVSSHGRVGPSCACTHKSPFYRNKRTPEQHTEELKQRGKDDYQCVSITSRKDVTYKHISCGFSFKMSIDCLLGSAVPCAKCRREPNRKTHQEFFEQVKGKLSGVTLLEEYTDCRVPIKVQYESCGCITTLHPDRLVRAEGAYLQKCPVCFPNRVWFRFNLAGKDFRTRSQVEKAFIEYALDKGVPVNKIVYEPKEKVYYTNPLTGKLARYSPDFLIGKTYVEVKNLGSLGLQGYYLGKHAKEVLLENRAKAQAALDTFGDYKVYVRLANGNFIRVYDFWTKKEQQRILALNS